eukprot:m.1115679 g.1115679  ORF g.1115679 m.1115679 type:complete len:971 (+) comp24371_c0_seq1:198-3110(+)
MCDATGDTVDSSGASSDDTRVPTRTGKKTKSLKSPMQWKKNVTFNLAHTHYQVLRDVINDLGFSVAKDSDKQSLVIWHNTAPPVETMNSLEPYQKINHFPGTGEISRKDCLARNLSKMQKICPKDYKFFPRSWILPAEAGALKKHSDNCKAKGKSVTYIYKPTNSAQGKGIMLAKQAADVPTDETLLVQEYLARPFLIDGFKFDLRLYVFVMSYDPMRVFLYRDGLVRLSTERYKAPSTANLDKLHMHLTNYSINKNAAEFDDSDAVDQGSKRTVAWMMEWLADNGHDPEVIWGKFADIIIKTLIVAHPHNVHAYRVSQRKAKSPRKGTSDMESMWAENSSNCFAILGFDVFLDHRLRPYVIEVNRSPSFTCDAPLDQDIKYGVIASAIKLLRLRPSEKTRSVNRAKQQCRERLLKPRTAPQPAGTRTAAGGKSTAARRQHRAADTRGHSAETGRTPHAEDMLGHRQQQQQEYEKARHAYEVKHQGLYRRIYPVSDTPPSPDIEVCIDTPPPPPVDGGEGVASGAHDDAESETSDVDVADIEPASPVDDAVPSKPHPAESAPGTSVQAPGTRTRAQPARESKHEVYLRLIEESTRIFFAQGGTHVSGNFQHCSTQQADTLSLRGDAGARSKHADMDDRDAAKHRAGGLDGRGKFFTAKKLTNPSMRTKSSPVRKTTSGGGEGAGQSSDSQLLEALGGVHIACPGYTQAQTKTMLGEIRLNWELHHDAVQHYWMVEIDCLRRSKIVDIVKSNVVEALTKLYPQKTVTKLRIYDVFVRVLCKLVSGHGEGLWNFFDTRSKSRQQSFSNVLSGSRTTPHEQKCARRIVELCEDCLLVVYICYIGYSPTRPAPKGSAGGRLVADADGDETDMVQLLQDSHVATDHRPLPHIGHPTGSGHQSPSGTPPQRAILDHMVTSPHPRTSMASSATYGRVPLPSGAASTFAPSRETFKPIVPRTLTLQPHTKQAPHTYES